MYMSAKYALAAITLGLTSLVTCTKEPMPTSAGDTPTPPTATNMRVVATTDTSISVAWRPSADTAFRAYVVAFGLDSTPVGRCTLGVASDTTFTAMGLQPSTRYFFCVTVCSDGALSAPSNMVDTFTAQSLCRMDTLRLTLMLTSDRTTVEATDTSTIPLIVQAFGHENTPLPGLLVRVIRQSTGVGGIRTSDTTTITTDSMGQRLVVVPAVATDGTVIVRAEALEDIQATATVSVECVSRKSVALDINPARIPADGRSAAEVRATVQTARGQAVSCDTLEFISSAGAVTAVAVTDSLGIAVAYLRSSRSTCSGVVTVRRVRSLHERDSARFYFDGVQIAAEMTPLDGVVNRAADTVRALFVVSDAAGQVIADEPVLLHTKGAFLICSTASQTGPNGAFSCLLNATEPGLDTLVVVCAGATLEVPLKRTCLPQLTVDTVPSQTLVADNADTTVLVARLTTCDGAPMPSCTLTVSSSVTFCTGSSIQKLVTDQLGGVRFCLPNPAQTTMAQVTVEWHDEAVEVTASRYLQFRAGPPDHLYALAIPTVLSAGSDTSWVHATVFDSLCNPVSGVDVYFRIAAGTGGGDGLLQSVATTGSDGHAQVAYVTGTEPTTGSPVLIVCSTLSGTNEDTVRLAVSAGPARVSLQAETMRGYNYRDGTMGLPVTAIVTDRNGNPVPAGTEVTFTCHITGYLVWQYFPRFTGDIDTWVGEVTCEIVTAYTILAVEDHNGNYSLDPGEDVNGDGLANRGEDVNGDGQYNCGPPFADINHNGVRDSFPEPFKQFFRPQADSTQVGGYRYVLDTAFADYNGNGRLDLVEVLAHNTLTWQQYAALRDAVPGGRGFDLDMDGNAVADPTTTISLTRTVKTGADGKAVNTLVYFGRDAQRLQVAVNAQCLGVVSQPPETLILPTVE